MMKLDSHGNFEPWVQPEYGFDANDKKVTTPKNHKILKRGDALMFGDVPFDVYSGWIFISKKTPHKPYQLTAWSSGRWTTWARPNYMKDYSYEVWQKNWKHPDDFVFKFTKTIRAIDKQTALEMAKKDSRKFEDESEIRNFKKI